MSRIVCPVCRTAYAAPAGEPAICPQCGHTSHVPQRQSPESARTASPASRPLVPPPTFEALALPIDGRGVPAHRRWFGRVRPRSGRGSGAIVILVVLALVIVVDPIFRLIDALQGGGAVSPDVQITPSLFVFTFIVNTVLFIMLPFVYLFLVYPGKPGLIIDEMRLRLRPKTPLWMLVGIGATWAGALALGGVVSGLVALGLMDEPPTSQIILALQPQLNVALIIMIPTVAALTEEIFFRGFLQPRVGLVGSSVLFGLVHIGYGTWFQVVAPLLLGFMFGYVYLKTRTLWAPIAGHFSFNLVQLLALYFTR